MRSILLLVLLCCTTPAWAIPSAGTYAFTSGTFIPYFTTPDGDVGLGDARPFTMTGTFTSTGSSVSAWSFSSNLFDKEFLNLSSPSLLSWDSRTDFPLPVEWNFNNANYFATNNAKVLDGSEGYYAGLFWNSNPAILTAGFRIDATCCDAFYNGSPSVTFTRTSVPEPHTWFSLLMALVAVASYAGLIRRPAKGQR